MPRDYSAYDLDEPRRIQMIAPNGDVSRLIWASINFCLEFFASEDQWAIDPVPTVVP